MKNENNKILSRNVQLRQIFFKKRAFTLTTIELIVNTLNPIYSY